MDGRGRYILDAAGEPLLCEDVMRWARWYEHTDEARQIARDDAGEGVALVTVFLALDYNTSGEGAPRLFSTRLEGGEEVYHSATRGEALTEHARRLGQFVAAHV